MRFECQPGCTACCEEQGFVYLTEDDIGRMAEYLGLSRAAFERKYVYRTTNLRRLRMPKLGRCTFLQEGGCSIHPAKPTQCRLFPFWPEVVKTERAWLKTGSWCPGIGKGKLVKIQTAESLAQEMRASHPRLYP